MKINRTQRSKIRCLVFFMSAFLLTAAGCKSSSNKREINAGKQVVVMPLMNNVSYSEAAKLTQPTSSSNSSLITANIDTTSYGNIRRILNKKLSPSLENIRLAEWINYFNSSDPTRVDTAFTLSTEIAPTPWDPTKQLLQITVNGPTPATVMEASNFVVIFDLAPSKNQKQQLKLIEASLDEILTHFRSSDSFTLITVAKTGAHIATTIIETDQTDARKELSKHLMQTHKESILEIAMETAYSVASSKVEGMKNSQVILITNRTPQLTPEFITQWQSQITHYSLDGISFSPLIFLADNYNPEVLQQLKQKSLGIHAYIETELEATHVAQKELLFKMPFLAKDAQLRVAFNPKYVSNYRLLGYEPQVTNNDTATYSTDIGFNHAFTALYEFELAETIEASPQAIGASDLARAGFIYKESDRNQLKSVERSLPLSAVQHDFASASHTFQFNAAVASFAMKLAGKTEVNTLSYKQIYELARRGASKSPTPNQQEFLSLIKTRKR